MKSTIKKRRHYISNRTNRIRKDNFSLFWLKEISDRSQNILTIEDPVEYALEGIGKLKLTQRQGSHSQKALELF